MTETFLSLNNMKEKQRQVRMNVILVKLAAGGFCFLCFLKDVFQLKGLTHVRRRIQLSCLGPTSVPQDIHIKNYKKYGF